MTASGAAREPNEPTLDLYDIAFLAGGPARVVDTAVVVEQPPADGVDGAVPDGTHGVEDGGLDGVSPGEVRGGQMAGGGQA